LLRALPPARIPSKIAVSESVAILLAFPVGQSYSFKCNPLKKKIQVGGYFLLTAIYPALKSGKKLQGFLEEAENPGC
jgi:hypothetical protein